MKHLGSKVCRVKALATIINLQNEYHIKAEEKKKKKNTCTITFSFSHTTTHNIYRYTITYLAYIDV